MQFKDAAYEILNSAKQPLHYNEIADQALAAGLLETTGKTPHATMGALLYTDTLNEKSRFKRADQKGYFTLKEAPPPDIAHQIEALNQQSRLKLRKLVHEMPAEDFEQLIAELLLALGLDESSIQVTPFSGDGGIDVRGKMIANGLTEINVAIQAKRWKANVGAGVVRDLRGSLKVHEQGIVMTPSDFTSAAKDEAHEPGKTHIGLINGDELVELMIRHKVGAYEEKYSVIYLDEERWEELLKQPPKAVLVPAQVKPLSKNIKFPISIRADHNGQTYWAELLDIKGSVRLNGQQYSTPSGAAKTIATDWKAVDGWNFWHFQDPTTKKWEKIGKLRKGI
jgi:restriction system protein